MLPSPSEFTADFADEGKRGLECLVDRTEMSLFCAGVRAQMSPFCLRVQSAAGRTAVVGSEPC